MKYIESKADHSQIRRMDRLAVLPVFFNLEGQKVLLVGGSDAAAWKAELLLAAGAWVDLYAGEMSADMEGLLTHERLIFKSEDWLQADVSPYRLCIADLETQREAFAFSAKADAAGQRHRQVRVLHLPVRFHR